MAGTVVEVIDTGAEVVPGTTLVVLEAMKMEHRVRSEVVGSIGSVEVAAGDTVEAGQRLVSIETTAESAPEDGGSAVAGAAGSPTDTSEADGRAPDALEELHQRRALLHDAARPEAVARRHDRGMRTARENVAALVDPGSFVEYGGFAIAAQRSRRPLDELQRETPADGLIAGIATVHADVVGVERAACAVLAYDYTVLAGTQGHVNHHKVDRLLTVAAERRLPIVLFAEGGGGRPGDTDSIGGSWLDVETFRRFARLSGQVPIIAIVDGYCFAGNAALAGCADILIATERSNLGMAGPAMIEGGGLGKVAPGDIGPIEVQRTNGVVDIVVADDEAAVVAARRCLAMFQGPAGAHGADTGARDTGVGNVEVAHVGARDTGVGNVEVAPEDRLRRAVPANRREGYDVRRIIESVFDPDSVVELQRDTAPGMVTALARLSGRPVGVLANDNRHLGGAIDVHGADAATRLFRLCDVHGLPAVVLCDTPGFMVGPEAEAEGGVRRFGAMFVAGAKLGPPLLAVVTRKAYGLGAQAMLGGHLKAPALTLAWPTAELGPMGLEGAVRLGYRRELEAIDDPELRAAREAEMITAAYEHAKALNVASFGELDDVIDPADTRRILIRAMHVLGRER